MPVVKNIFFGELEYQDQSFEDPAIEEDRVCCTIAIRLKRKGNSEDFELHLFSAEDEAPQIFKAVNADSKTRAKNQNTGKFLHFHLDSLQCKTTYRYQIVYKETPLVIERVAGQPRQEIIIRTPPARRDPQPIKIAVGGDQERQEQLGPLGRMFDLNNADHTTLLYRHMGNEGEFEATVESDITKQPYQLFIHLGDLFNGEYYFSLRNLFRSGRKILEPSVHSLNGFRHHLSSDFAKPVGNNMAQMAYGFYPLVDDHDTGKNNSKSPKTKKELAARQNMEQAFHEMTLMPNFLSQIRYENGVDNDIGRAGPYYKKRIGQSEFFFLHNRFTMDNNKDEAYILGEEQWKWLEEVLQNSRASNKVLISPLPFVMGKKPTEDYRAHWQEWHRLMQLCRQHKIATILTADSHNYSHSEIHVRENPDDLPWVIHQHLIGTLGGSKQFICAEELQQINSEGRPPLLPKGEGFDSSLYEGSTVRAYFSPGSKSALLPVSSKEEDLSMSQWTAKGDWQKNTHGYAGMVFQPLLEPAVKVSSPIIDMKEEEIEMEGDFQKGTQVKSWQIQSSLFTCTGKRNTVLHEERLNCEYSFR